MIYTNYTDPDAYESQKVFQALLMLERTGESSAIPVLRNELMDLFRNVPIDKNGNTKTLGDLVYSCDGTIRSTSIGSVTVIGPFEAAKDTIPEERKKAGRISEIAKLMDGRKKRNGTDKYYVITKQIADIRKKTPAKMKGFSVGSDLKSIHALYGFATSTDKVLKDSGIFDEISTCSGTAARINEIIRKSVFSRYGTNPMRRAISYGMGANIPCFSYETKGFAYMDPECIQNAVDILLKRGITIDRIYDVLDQAGPIYTLTWEIPRDDAITERLFNLVSKDVKNLVKDEDGTIRDAAEKMIYWEENAFETLFNMMTTHNALLHIPGEGIRNWLMKKGVIAPDFKEGTDFLINIATMSGIYAEDSYIRPLMTGTADEDKCRTWDEICPKINEIVKRRFRDKKTQSQIEGQLKQSLRFEEDWHGQKTTITIHQKQKGKTTCPT